MSEYSVEELRAIGVKDMRNLLDRCGIQWSSYTRNGEDMTRFKDKEGDYIGINSWIVTMNTGYDGTAADLAGTFRYALKRGFVTIEDLPKVISPEVLPIIRDVLKDCPLEWPDGKIETIAERGGVARIP